jgi:hypothetical protein
MTSAVATPSSPSARPHQAVPIIILGTDALLAALPATPVQLAHACLRAGFANAVPASWGDELIAAAVLRRLPQFAGGPAIQCSCPMVAHRLLNVGSDLRPAMMGLVPPPVAIARYVRALSGATPVRITYVGGCPGANDDAIDIRMRPDALLALLAEREILLEDQPRVFESIIPPDRRRFRSQPGGVPTVDALWSDVGARTLVEVDGDDFVSELAQQLLTGKNVLIDAAAHLGCVCAGAVAGVPVKDARAGVVALEPPRATMPIVEEHAPIELELAVPAAARAPVDVSAALAHLSPARGILAVTAPAPVAPHRFSPVRGLPVISEVKAPRASGPFNQRSVLGTAPVTRDGEGKPLPRAYVARRRSSPRGIPAIAISDHPLQPPPSRPSRTLIKSTSDSSIAIAPESPPTPGAPKPADPSAAESTAQRAATATSIAASPADAPAYSPASGARRPSPPLSKPESMLPTPAPVVREPREARELRSVPDFHADTPRPARPRPSVTVERDAGPNLTTRRLIVLGIGAVVLCVVMSVISAYIVARVVRSSSPTTSASTTTAAPPSITP